MTEQNVNEPVAMLQSPVWEVAQSLQCEVALDIPVPNFTIADLVRISKGEVIETEWKQDGDVPLTANGTLFGWAAFEVVGEQLAARVTDLA